MAGATVVVRDRTGCVLKRGRTEPSGTFSLRVTARNALRYPLTVTATGGRAASARFGGTMRARVFAVHRNSPVTQVSLVSTAASRMSHKKTGYARATKKVRKTLGIAKGSLPDVLRYRNSDVGYRQLVRKIRSTKGRFDGFAAKVARQAEAGRVIRGLRPSSAMESGPRRSSAQVEASASPETSVCDAPVPSNGNTSDEIISDIAAIGVGGLLEYAGAPSTSADGITGMLLAPIGQDSGATVAQQDVQDVMAELTCISEQINYLSAQISQLAFTVDVDTATSCASAVSTDYNDYSYLVNNASQYPLNSLNSTLTSDLPLWNDLNNTCGDAINDMLFGTSGGQASAWQQLNQNYSSGVEWYTQEQVQGLQTFLSYWGTILYQQFILTNEYANYYGEWESAQVSAGGTNPDGTGPVCSAGSGPETPTFCVWQNSISAAYPGDLYSDEIGLIGNGVGVNANPGGMIAPAPIFATESQTYSPTYLKDTNASANESYSPTAMNPGWWYNFSLNFVQYDPDTSVGTAPLTLYANGTIDCDTQYPGCFSGGVPTSWSNWTTASANQFNNQGVNPNDYGSAVQTFWNPQNTARQPVAWSSVSDLGSKGPGGATAQEVFYDAINQTPSPYPSTFAADGAWSSVSSGQTAYWTNDTSSWAKFQVSWALSDFSFQMWSGAPLGDAPSSSAGNAYQLPATPLYAYLTQRAWWSGSSSATSFQPPQPPT